MGKKLFATLFILLFFVTNLSFAVDSITARIISPSGDIVSAWVERNATTGVGTIVIASKLASGNWTTPYTISDTSVSSASPSITVNDSGNGVIGWIQDDPINGVSALYASFFTVGDDPDSPVRVSSTTENVLNPLITLISKGSLIADPVASVVWNAYLGSNTCSSTRFSSAEFNQSWSSPITISNQ